MGKLECDWNGLMGFWAKCWYTLDCWLLEDLRCLQTEFPLVDLTTSEEGVEWKQSFCLRQSQTGILARHLYSVRAKRCCAPHIVSWPENGRQIFNGQERHSAQCPAQIGFNFKFTDILLVYTYFETPEEVLFVTRTEGAATKTLCSRHGWQLLLSGGP